MPTDLNPSPFNDTHDNVIKEIKKLRRSKFGEVERHIKERDELERWLQAARIFPVDDPQAVLTELCAALHDSQ